MISNATPESVATILHSGMMADIKTELRKKLLAEVDIAIEKVVKNMRGMVKADFDPLHQQPRFFISIDKGDTREIT